jgi:hypothetical protein
LTVPFSDYRNDLIDESAPSPDGETGVRQTKIDAAKKC